ncbi:Alpha/beta hydrolase family protein [Sporobacter termitidis DSM 10068]|uniref:Alpha/beta hydrolase family protein n=1 Tax=Sporobacter termitidis DSM 10068 TaxID=1123282 RepID=A0A1M5Z6W1_9FIRM|nr:alpha/beta hydrolase [Sporobacter termitidis]SHI19997.1 Alpha/beta hydrolase family protein [Sporobacter termitidis DSM 10068]
METKKNIKLKIALVCVLAFLIVLIGGFYIYTLSYYRADSTAVASMTAADVMIDRRGNDIIFRPSPDKDLSTALIFYPGGKVEYIAYAPLLEQLTREGLTCVLVKMPFNLAFFNLSAADRVYELLPEIKNWYIGGHALGGVMASSYVWKDSTHVRGLVLLGAYPFTSSSLPTLAVYGSEDVKLEKKKLEGVKNVVEIMGGNSAGFGNYGDQFGDGTATITREDQQAQTVRAVMDFIGNKNK